MDNNPFEVLCCRTENKEYIIKTLEDKMNHVADIVDREFIKIDNEYIDVTFIVCSCDSIDWKNIKLYFRDFLINEEVEKNWKLPRYES